MPNPFIVFVALGRTLEILYHFFIVSGFAIILILLAIVFVLVMHELRKN